MKNVDNHVDCLAKVPNLCKTLKCMVLNAIELFCRMH